MSTSPLISIILLLPLMSTTSSQPPSSQATMNAWKGISSYCEKSQSTALLWYPPTPIECCDSRGQCDDYMEPNESNHGLRNPDKTWRRRSCHCDMQLWECVTRNMSEALIHRTRTFAFKSERCYRPRLVVNNGVLVPDGYEFVNFLDTLPRAR